MRRFRHLFALVGATALIVAASSLASSPVQAAATSQTFDVPGTYDFVVAVGVTSLTVDAYGASGGSGDGDPAVAGGLGGRTTATIAVTPGETLKVVVGGAGQSWSDNGTALGGSNGGGDAGDASAGGGGGASDVRQGGASLADRVVVAGGGGGGGGGGRCDGFGTGGDGGGDHPTIGGAPFDATGGSPGSSSSGGAGGSGSRGPTSTGSDGAAGDGGVGGFIADDEGAGGGGGGWFGGGGGGITYSGGAGGGGGSAYAVDTATAVSFENGVRSGAGQIVLTWTVPAPTTTTPPTTAAPTPTPTPTPVAPPAPGGPVAAYGSTPGQGGTSITVAAGGALELNSSGWLPGSSVTATMYSSPVRLGEVAVDADGSFVTQLTVPASAANGSHRLELTGVSADGEPAAVNLNLTVTGGTREAAALAFVC